jgi:plasmid stabilization system protein ParE
MKVVFTREAEKDLIRVIEHYAGQRDELGNEFIDAVDELVLQIGKWPMAGRSLDPSIRGRTLGRFPYGIRDEPVAYLPRIDFYVAP